MPLQIGSTEREKEMWTAKIADHRFKLTSLHAPEWPGPFESMTRSSNAPHKLMLLPIPE